jgi:hypothetical protein
MLFRFTSKNKQRQSQEGHNDGSVQGNSSIWIGQDSRDNDVGEQVTQEQPLFLK